MKKSRKRTLRRSLSIAAGVVAAGALLAVGTGYKNLRNAANNMYAYAANNANEGRNLNNLLKQKKAINVMLVGLGHNSEDADAVMMMTINPQTNSSKIVSVPKEKVADDYAKKGVSGLMTALHKTYKVPVDAYITINVNGLSRAIDKIGGIEVNGQHMNGDQAVKFIAGNQNGKDYSKTVLPVMKGILSKAGSFKTIFNNDFLNELSGDIQTDMNFGQLTKFGTNYGSAAQNSESSVAGSDASVVTKTIKDELK